MYDEVFNRGCEVADLITVSEVIKMSLSVTSSFHNFAPFNNNGRSLINNCMSVNLFIICLNYYTSSISDSYE